MNVYESCPQFVSDHFLIRQVSMDDCGDLLKVYSDPAAWPIFNCDNCTGDFHMTRLADVANCVSFWLSEYAQQYYVRWSVVDRAANCAIGTIELFNRKESFSFDSVGLLRLDLRSDYETEAAITEILGTLLPDSFNLFSCKAIATKIPPCAESRLNALTQMGFTPAPEPLYTPDGKAYGDYYIIIL